MPIGRYSPVSIWFGQKDKVEVGRRKIKTDLDAFALQIASERAPKLIASTPWA